MNYTDPNFNVSLCYEKLGENETHAFLHYETGKNIWRQNFDLNNILPSATCSL